jgi:hypothetical protein
VLPAATDIAKTMCGVSHTKELQKVPLADNTVGRILDISYFLTPWCRILFANLIVTQLVKKVLPSLWNPKVH